MLRLVQLIDGELLLNWYFRSPASMSVDINLGDWTWLRVDADYVNLSFRLWMPFLLVIIPTAVLWWHDSSRLRPGHCQQCGYDLRASPERCPECGLAVPGRACETGTSAKRGRG